MRKTPCKRLPRYKTAHCTPPPPPPEHNVFTGPHQSSNDRLVPHHDVGAKSSRDCLALGAWGLGGWAARDGLDGLVVGDTLLYILFRL